MFESGSDSELFKTLGLSRSLTTGLELGFELEAHGICPPFKRTLALLSMSSSFLDFQADGAHLILEDQCQRGMQVAFEIHRRM